MATPDWQKGTVPFRFGRLPAACIRRHARGILTSAMAETYMNYIETDLDHGVELVVWRRNRLGIRRPRRRLRLRFA